jgi:hypothetical protein
MENSETVFPIAGKSKKVYPMFTPLNNLVFNITVLQQVFFFTVEYPFPESEIRILI